MVKIVVKIKIKFLFLCYNNKKKFENVDYLVYLYLCLV